ncbi:hypothetical protein AK812_SmicGene17131 [Symbiodinium microadriaticum]|uniref:Uncharacterized protein n=1 Tax=Symbiodinium microadriaticum TaxID=2951 RepID=A0A1Q9DYK1_SYMMI|nr:hypothetical protein AK812_SmicGene17131 [Symbiodinium microadriaticum]
MTYSSTVRAKELLGEVISITALLTDDEALRLSCGFTVEELLAKRRLAGDLLRELAEHLDRVCRDTGIARTTGGGTVVKDAYVNSASKRVKETLAELQTDDAVLCRLVHQLQANAAELIELCCKEPAVLELLLPLIVIPVEIHKWVKRTYKGGDTQVGEANLQRIYRGVKSAVFAVRILEFIEADVQVLRGIAAGTAAPGFDHSITRRLGFTVKTGTTAAKAWQMTAVVFLDGVPDLEHFQDIIEGAKDINGSQHAKAYRHCREELTKATEEMDNAILGLRDTDLFSRSTSSSPSLRIPEASSSAATVAEEDFGERSGQPQSKRVRLLTASEVQARDSRQTSESAPLAATLRLVEPGERLTRTPIPSPSTPYLQSWTRTLPDGRKEPAWSFGKAEEEPMDLISKRSEEDGFHHSSDIRNEDSMVQAARSISRFRFPIVETYSADTDEKAALRGFGHDERFAAVRGLEAEAKAPGSDLTRLARDCLASLARDEGMECRQQADAPKFLTDASWAPTSPEAQFLCVSRAAINLAFFWLEQAVAMALDWPLTKSEKQERVLELYAREEALRETGESRAFSSSLPRLWCSAGLLLQCKSGSDRPLFQRAAERKGVTAL